MLKCKSIYDKPAPNDGARVFVDLLWPEGISTRHAAVAWWAKELAPSYELWRHGSTAEQWPQYHTNYTAELRSRDRQPALEKLRQSLSQGNVTLLYGTADPSRNNAVIVREFLEGGEVKRKK